MSLLCDIEEIIVNTLVQHNVTVVWFLTSGPSGLPQAPLDALGYLHGQMVSHTKSDQGGGVNNSMRFSDLGSHGIPLQQSIRLAIGEIIVMPKTANACIPYRSEM